MKNKFIKFLEELNENTPKIKSKLNEFETEICEYLNVSPDTLDEMIVSVIKLSLIQKRNKEKLIQWYKEEFTGEEAVIVYHDTLVEKESIHCHRIESPYGAFYSQHVSPYRRGCKEQFFIKFESEK